MLGFRAILTEWRMRASTVGRYCGIIGILLTDAFCASSSTTVAGGVVEWIQQALNLATLALPATVGSLAHSPPFRLHICMRICVSTSVVGRRHGDSCKRSITGGIVGTRPTVLLHSRDALVRRGERTKKG